MGIKQLTMLLADNAPGAFKEREIKSYFGRKIAIDASMLLYQFLIAIKTDGQSTLTDADGESTAHINGFFYRTLRLVDSGIKPVFVFDGKPPTMKGGELAKRSDRKHRAQEKLKEAREEGNQEAMEKAGKMTVRVTRDQTAEVKKLLRLMGIPVIEATCEAEATCAVLAKSGKIFGVGTEDMDALTFGTPILLRHITYSEARKMPIKEIHLARALDELKLTMDQFIDLCILLGCDYMDTIRGVGPKSALDLIREHGSLEKVLEALKGNARYTVPEHYPFEEARALFKNPDVTQPDSVSLEWTDPDEEGLIQFMCVQKGFNEERVKGGIAKLRKNKQSTVQGRLTSFFGAPIAKKSDSLVRHREEKAAAAAAKEKKRKAAAAKKKNKPPSKKLKTAAKSKASAKPKVASIAAVSDTPAAATAVATAAATTTTTTSTPEKKEKTEPAPSLTASAAATVATTATMTETGSIASSYIPSSDAIVTSTGSMASSFIPSSAALSESK